MDVGWARGCHLEGVALVENPGICEISGNLGAARDAGRVLEKSGNLVGISWESRGNRGVGVNLHHPAKGMIKSAAIINAESMVEYLYWTFARSL